MPASVEITLTNHCNWSCDYCLVDTHNQPVKKWKDVIKEAESLPPETEVTFSGGEPGLISRAKLEQLINILKDKNCPLDLLTNGLFIRKHEPLLKDFAIVMYHCLEYMTDEHEIEFPNLDQDKFRYVLIAQNEDLENGSIVKIFERYPHIRFLLLPETRYKRKINFNLFTKFLKKHKDSLFPDNLYEVSCKISRSWGESDWEKINTSNLRAKINGSTG